MINWNNAWDGDLQLLNSINILLDGHSNLLNFLFHKSKPQFKCSSEELLKQAKSLSKNEYMLVQLALDLWDGSGQTLFIDVMNMYGGQQFIQLIKSMNHLNT